MIKYFFLTYLTIYSLTASSEQLYEYIANLQEITGSELQVGPNHELSSFYSKHLILSSTPSIKFYADLLVEEGLPIDLVVLPLMESGNNPNAKSPKNALGLWQFMPSTGRDWGLSSSHGIDDRRNAIKATRAAIRYLNYLHKEFNDWNLVLAAYNWGMGNVRKALKQGLLKNNRINLNLLPRETANYLLAFHHLNRLIRVSYNSNEFKKFPNQPFLDMIKKNDIENYIIKNNILELNYGVLQHINGYEIDKHDTSNPYVLVPTQTFLNYFMTSKISYKPVKKSSRPVKKTFKCTTSHYRARRGDTIKTLSKKFKIGVSDFNEINPAVYHVRPGMLVKVCP